MVAAFVLITGASSAHAANPGIINTGTGCSGQTTWLVSCATTGEDGAHSSAHQIRMSVLASHDIDNLIASLITDDDWDGTVDPTTVRSVSAQRPSIFGGYPRSRVNLSYSVPNLGSTGIDSGFACVGATRRIDSKAVRIQARDNNTPSAQTSGTSSSTIKFTAAGQCTGAEDYAYLYDWGANNFVNSTSLEPGESKTFTYTGDDPDTTGDSDFQGIRWRKRNLRTGAVSGTTEDCDNNGDNAVKSTTVSFPDRGAFVVEAELLDGGCEGDNQNNGYWFPIGTADVNSGTAPDFDLAATRPQFNGNTTVSADSFSDPDSGDGGGVQIVEWDLNGDTGDGVSGFETTPNIASEGSRFTGSLSKTHSTNGETPGLHTVRARVTDNGAMDAADSIRKTRIVSTTYLVDSAPTANSQTVSTQSNATSLPITLTGADPDGDALSFPIVDQPDHGQLCTQAPPAACSSGTGPSRFYIPDGDFAGTDSFTFRTDDGFGRQSATAATVNINVSPDTQIDSHPDTTSGQNTATFNFSSAASSVSPDPAVSFECRLDSNLESDFQPNCTSPRLYAGLSDASHKFDVRARLGSFVDPTPASFTWIVDSTLPETFIDSGPSDPTSQSIAAFVFHSDDPLATFQCRLDNDPLGFQTCTSPAPYTGLAEGEHVFEVRATDSFNRTDPIPATHTWNVDLTAPAVTINSAPENPTNQTAATFDFSSTDLTATFQCRLDSNLEAAFIPCTSPQTYGNVVPLAEGSHTFEVRPTDPAGNVGDVVSRTWSIDVTVPNTNLTAGPPSQTNSSVASFQFNSPPVDNASGFECRLDGSAWEECSSPELYADVGDGSHIFDVRATDAAGNVDASPASQTWLVDTTAPQTSIGSSPQNPTSSPSASFSFSADDVNATFECKLDSGSWQPGCTSVKQYLTLPQGQHTFRVRGTDALGNTDPTPATRTWTIDTTPPVVEIDAGPQNPSGSSSASFQFSADDPGASFECRLDSNLVDDYEECDSPHGLSGLDEGAHTFDVRAIDALGNTGPTDSRTWTVDTLAPNVTIDSRTPSGNPTSSSSISFTFHSDDFDAGFDCRLDGGGWQGCASGKSYSGLDDGQHTFDVRAHDAVGNTSDPVASDTWTIADSGPPNVTIDSGPAAGVATTADFTFSADEPSSFQCKLDSGAFVDCGSGMAGTRSYTGLQVGPHTFTVLAHDGDGPDPSPAVWSWQVAAPSSGGGTAGATAKSPVITPGKSPLKRGRGTAAMVSCPTGPCTVTGRAKVRIAGTSFVARVRATSPLASGNAANVTVVLPKAARAALAAAGKGVLKLQLTASSGAGNVSKNIKLKVTK